MIVTGEMVNAKPHLNKDLWETPPHIYAPLHREFRFTLDPCCTKETAKCEFFYTPEDDGLSKSWEGHTCFVNPPYSRGNIDKWVEMCRNEGNKLFTRVVALLPVSTSADWFHKFIIDQAEVRFIDKRVRFVNAPYTAPFSSMIVVFGGNNSLKSFKQK